MTNTKKKNLIIFLLLFPVFIFTVLPLLLEGLTTFILSFTFFNVLELPIFYGFENYINYFNDATALTLTLNTTIITCLVGFLLLLFAIIPALQISKTNKFLGILTNTFYFAASFTTLSVFDSIITYFFANTETTKLVVFLLVIIFLFGVCSFPVFVISYVFSRLKSRFWGLLVGLCSIPLFITIFSHFQTALTGYPSVDYVTDTLSLYIEYIAKTRFDIGYASALTVIGAILFLIWCAVCVVAVILMRIILRSIKKDYKLNAFIGFTNKIMTVLAFIFSAFGLLWFITLFTITCLNSLKPIDELLIYPPKLAVLRPTLENFSSIIEFYNAGDFSLFENALAQIFVNVIICTFAVIPNAIGYYLSQDKKFAFLFLLPPFTLLLNQAINTLSITYTFKISYLPETVNSAICYVFMFIIAYLTVKLFAKKPKLRIITVILGVISYLITPAATAIIINSVHYYAGWLSRNIAITYSGLARIGAASAGDLMHSLFTAFVLIIPATLLIVLALLNKTRKQS